MLLLKIFLQKFAVKNVMHVSVKIKAVHKKICNNEVNKLKRCHF